MTDQTEPKPIIDQTLLANTSMDHSSDSEDSGGASPLKKAFRDTVWRKSMVNPTKKSTAQIINIMNEKIYKLQDVKKINVQYQRYRRVNFLFGISIIIPILLSIFTVDLEFEGGHPELLDNLLQACVWVTLVSIILNVMRYRQKLIYKKTTNNVPKETNIFTSGRIWNLLMEIIILMLVPNPWTNGIQIQSYDEDDGAMYYFNFNDILAVFIMLRMFFVVRMVLQMSRYMSPTVVRLSYFFGTRNSGTYAIKCLLKRHPMRTLFVTYFSSITIFAYMIRICERPLILIPGNEDTMQISDYWNALWYVVVTMTTVGYGDFYAHTNLGRLVSFFCCTWGALVISIMVVVFTNVLDMDQSENKILVIMERLYLRKKLKTKAAIVIQSVARFIFARNKQKADEKHLQLLVIRIRNNVKKFQKIHTRLKALNDRENTNEEMSREFEFMRYEMREIKQTIKNVTATFASDSKVSEQFTMRTGSVQSDRNMSLTGFKLTPV